MSPGSQCKGCPGSVFLGALRNGHNHGRVWQHNYTGQQFVDNDAFASQNGTLHALRQNSD